MACSPEFIDSIIEILSPLGEVRSRKMMGDYVIYLNDKCVITACDNTAFVKKLPCIADIMADAETGCAYEGAKESYILPLDDPSTTRKAISALWNSLPLPKPKKQK